MDENKDLQTPETTGDITEDTQAVQDAVEENAGAVTEAVEAEAAAGTADNAEEAVAENTEEALEAVGGEAAETAPAEEAPKSKKPLIQKTIIISLIIVLLAVIATLAVRLFFNNDVTGTWHLVRQVQVMDENATSDEATSTLDVDYYFTFNSDGTVKSTIGTVSSEGTYTTSKNEDDKTVVNMNIYDTLTQYFLQGDYTVEMSGNIFTGKKMVFTSVDSADQSYEFDSASYTAPEIKREGEFEKNDAIVGKWVYSTGEFNLMYEFKADGTARYSEEAMTINPYTYTPINLDINMDGIYTVKDKTVTITYYFLEQADRDIQIRVDGDVLYINDYPFTKEGAATVDQAAATQAQQ